jgi:alpha-L-rhamnosidase
MFGEIYLKNFYPLEELIQKGLTTFLESNEPSRSDCHAWSASPLYFYYSLVAGIEPASPGFSRIRIAPSLGNLKQLSASMPHPKGTIITEYNIDKKGTLTARLSIPEGTSGVFMWKGKEYELKENEQEFVIRARN